MGGTCPHPDPKIHMESDPIFPSPQSYSSGQFQVPEKKEIQRKLYLGWFYTAHRNYTMLPIPHNVTNSEPTKKHYLVSNKAYFCIAMGGFGGPQLLQVKESIAILCFSHVSPIHGSYV